jgi:hypothetical protein
MSARVTRRMVESVARRALRLQELAGSDNHVGAAETTSFYF